VGAPRNASIWPMPASIKRICARIVVATRKTGIPPVARRPGAGLRADAQSRRQGGMMPHRQSATVQKYDKPFFAIVRVPWPKARAGCCCSQFHVRGRQILRVPSDQSLVSTTLGRHESAPRNQFDGEARPDGPRGKSSGRSAAFSYLSESVYLSATILTTYQGCPTGPGSPG
jgi:hypothetical protein